MNGRVIEDEHPSDDADAGRRDPALEQHRHGEVQPAPHAGRAVRGAAGLRLRHRRRASSSRASRRAGCGIRAPGPSESPASLAMGYELAVTPLQLAAAYGALANGGVLLEPTLVRQVRDADGEHAVDRARASGAAGGGRGHRRAADADAAGRGGGGHRDGAPRWVPTWSPGKTGTARRAVGGHYLPGDYCGQLRGHLPGPGPAIGAGGEARRSPGRVLRRLDRRAGRAHDPGGGAGHARRRARPRAGWCGRWLADSGTDSAGPPPAPDAGVVVAWPTAAVADATARGPLPGPGARRGGHVAAGGGAGAAPQRLRGAHPGLGPRRRHDARGGRAGDRARPHRRRARGGRPCRLRRCARAWSARGCWSRWPAGAPAVIPAITTDSRHVERDALFLAYVGSAVDGHAYVAAAARAGAGVRAGGARGAGGGGAAGAGPRREAGRVGGGQRLLRQSGRRAGAARGHRDQRQDHDGAPAAPPVRRPRAGRLASARSARSTGGATWCPRRLAHHAGPGRAVPRRSRCCATTACRPWRWKRRRTASTRTGSPAWRSAPPSSPTSPATTSTITATRRTTSPPSSSSTATWRRAASRS